MSGARARHGRGGRIPTAVVVFGVVLVAYGLGVATWVSSSDSSTRFVELSYGDPPYGFKRAGWVEVVARPYFNGGAWILLLGVAMLACIALLTRSVVAAVSALAMSLVAVLWSLAAILTLELVDLQFGAYLPTIGYACVIGAVIALNPSAHWSWLLFGSAVLATAAAVMVWYLPVNAFDSSCSLATRNRYDNDDACADAFSMLTRSLVEFVLAAAVFAISGTIVAIQRRNRPGERRPDASTRDHDTTVHL